MCIGSLVRSFKSKAFPQWNGHPQNYMKKRDGVCGGWGVSNSCSLVFQLFLLFNVTFSDIPTIWRRSVNNRVLNRQSSDQQHENESTHLGYDDHVNELDHATPLVACYGKHWLQIVNSNPDLQGPERDNDKCSTGEKRIKVKFQCL